MKIAVAGKGGVGKTTITAWLGDFLARAGRDVWLVDADTALSLGQASGLERAALPVPLVEQHDLVMERIGKGVISLSPEVADLPETLSVDLPVSGEGSGRKRLLVMGTVTNAGGGCACAANALLKSLLAHLIMEREEWVLADLEAGVEHLGRGVVDSVDALIIVAEPGLRSLETGAVIGRLAGELDVRRRVLVLNRCNEAVELPKMEGLPKEALFVPPLEGLAARQLSSGSVLELPEQALVDGLMRELVENMLK